MCKVQLLQATEQSRLFYECMNGCGLLSECVDACVYSKLSLFCSTDFISSAFSPVIPASLRSLSLDAPEFSDDQTQAIPRASHILGSGPVAKGKMRVWTEADDIHPQH